ncbi:MAG: hypothetical protein D8M59_16220 [Planctomycetes bacterium]|nr:hypothetical protein [Planctomycetota bacterium]
MASTGTELWLHGGGYDFRRSADAGATGIRIIYDLRRPLPMKKFVAAMRDMNRRNMGLALTVRWKDPDHSGGQNKTDTPPTAAEKAQGIDLLLRLLTTPEAAEMGERLWVQFYNEIVAGAGSIDPSDADGMFDFATDAAIRIRREAPTVKITGPGVSTVAEMNKDMKGLSGLRKDRMALKQRMLEWAVTYADAQDLHLHVATPEEAAHELNRLREELDKIPGGTKTDIVVHEWSPSRYTDRSDTRGIQRAIQGIWDAMADADVIYAAYGSLIPAKWGGNRFGWQALLDDKGQPNEPFYSTFKTLSETKAAQPEVKKNSGQ